MEEELATVVEQRNHFQALQSALENIRESCVDRIGAEHSAKLERLPGLAGRILVLLDGIATRRDPSLASAVPDASGAAQAAEAASSVPAGAVASMADVAAALAAVANYFGRAEPSNPALLLVRQAEGLIGKSFLDAMRALAPNHIEQAKFQIGKDHLFDLPLERLAPFAEIATEEAPVEEASSTEELMQTDDNPRKIIAATRADAVRLLEQVGAYYRVAEPSSPIPFLTERARTLAERDFVSLLKEMLPGDSLKGPTGG
jgi:type VI secretion system protein ImpA